MGLASQLRRQAILQRSRGRSVSSFRSAAAGRFAPPPTRRASVQRPGGFTRRAFVGRRAPLPGYRMARGGFFKDVFKGVKKVVSTVTKLPVIGAVAKAAVATLPVVGQVVTAVNAFKAKTPVGAAASPIGGVTAVSGAAPVFMTAPARRAPRRKAKRAKRAKRGKRAKAKKRAGGTAKQRAARARFARAARKGRIKKGTRLG